MNREAKALGMTHTHFQNPAGITMPEHYSTAADLARLSAAVVNQTPDYLYYSKQPSFSYNNHFHRATNRVLQVDSSVDGLKLALLVQPAITWRSPPIVQLMIWNCPTVV